MVLNCYQSDPKCPGGHSLSKCLTYGHKKTPIKYNIFTLNLAGFTVSVGHGKLELLPLLSDPADPRAEEPEPGGAGCFWLLGARTALKNQKPEPLGKKVRRRSR